ncbi:hypothetical protein ACFL6S_01865 [Candidatus Poribacteria bacterium]
MSLYEALQRRGYSFRQHLEEEGWTQRKLTVIDLDDSQRAALERGGVNGLKQILDRQGLWSFPALDIENPLPIQSDVILTQDGRSTAIVVAPASEGAANQMAREFVNTVHQQFGFKLTSLEDDAAGLDLLKSQHVIVFGGSHENQFAMDMALRYQACFVDATVPGDDGWIATTHVGLDASGHNVMQIAASPSRRNEALAHILQNVSADDNQVVLRHTHHITPGGKMSEHLPSWEKFVAGLPGSVLRLQGQSVEAPQDPVALAKLLSIGLDSGGPDVNIYNVAPIDIAVKSARYYQLSGDLRALQLFRELLFTLTDYYLKTPDGASYPSDLDFRIGYLLLYYSRLEHHQVFSEEDRLILVSLLLSCIRSIYEYTLKCWPINPDEPTRHNHETFAALSLLFAADYFSRYEVPYVKDWRARADLVFSGYLWRRFKQRENANHYEQYAFEHAAVYSAFTGHKLDLFDQDSLRWGAMRQVITTDNFFRPVDYGDAGISMKSGTNDTLITIVSSQQDDPALRWYSHESFERQHHYLPLPLGIRRTYDGASPQAGVWELLPLDPGFIEQFCPGFPEEYAFDKLVFRTGWSDDDHYVLLEGVGNQEISHSHNELNSITRLNHLGRHWIVSNGYGRLAGMTNVAKSFSTRVRGPEDHNMLVLKHNGQIVRELPVCSALVQHGQVGDLAFATCALLGYAGTDWLRTLLILADRFVLVIDRIHIAQPGLESGHMEWNCPGKTIIREEGFRVDQQGIFMDVDSDSGWATQTGVADRSADWKRTLDSGAYPYAEFPLKRLIFQMPDVEVGGSLCLSTLLAVTRSAEPAYRVRESEPGLICVDALHSKLPDLRMDDQDLSVRVDASRLEVRFDPKPSLPEALHAWSAKVKQV